MSRPVLFVSIVLIASLSNAKADDITYNIVDYPANEADEVSGTDTISGTIITDGTMGPLSAANIVGGSFSFTGAFDSLSGPASFGDPVGLEATPTQLLLDPDAESSFSIGTTKWNSAINFLGAGVVYENYPGGGQYYGSIAGTNGDFEAIFAYFNSVPVPTEQGSIGANSSWVIATVPEPASLTLFCSALLGLGAVYLRRRRADAAGQDKPARKVVSNVSVIYIYQGRECRTFHGDEHYALGKAARLGSLNHLRGQIKTCRRKEGRNLAAVVWT
jgi:hypothetical protein